MKPYYLEVLEKRVPGRDLIRELARRAWRRVAGRPDAGRQVWTPADVVDADGPELSLRSYLEHRDIRAMVAEIPAARRSTALELGSGYARLTVVFQESFKRVIAAEREPGLIDIARERTSGLELVRLEALDRLEAVPGPVDLAMLFTVLIHMTDADARKTLDALKAKVVKGWILIVERTDGGAVVGDNTKSGAFMDHGRSVASFEEWMRPFRLVKTMPRVIEPTYARTDNGTYMLFSNA